MAEVMYRPLHEVIDIIDVMCNMQVNGTDTAIPLLRGAPGGGKTESIRHMVQKNGDEFLSCHLALKQPEDLGGIPQFSNININNQEILSTKWSIPEIFESLLKLSDSAKKKGKKVIFFLDDIHRCGPFHVTALFELLTERKLREIKIPDNVAIVLAGNGSIKAGAQLTNSAIINRCSVMDVQTDFNYWREHYAAPHDFNMHILSFLANQRYHKHFHGEEDINNPWPSPRAWSKLSNVLNYYLNGKTKASADKIEYICRAHVGYEATKDFISYYQLIAKFKVGDIFKKVGEGFKKNSLKKVVEDTITEIQKYDELEQFALSHALLIEFTQKSKDERKKFNYYEILCAILLSFIQNPKNTFPEICISILKELVTFILKDETEKDFVRTTYDNMATSIGSPKINEHIKTLIRREN